MDEHYTQEYEQAYAAYTQEDYEEAARIATQLIERYPDDPNARLLCGYIYGYGYNQYDVAREQYDAVLSLTDDPELTEAARAAIAHAAELESVFPGRCARDRRRCRIRSGCERAEDPVPI